jgi:hypothetical protein
MNEIEIFKIHPTNYMVRICSLLRDATFEILKGVERLQDHPVSPPSMPSGQGSRK